MAIITRRITNNLNYLFTIPCPGDNSNQNANLIIPASVVDLDLLTLTTEDNLWTLQPLLLSLQRNGDISVTGTMDTASFDYDGVASLHVDSSPDIRGDVHLISGTNVSISQTGQDITINSTSSGGGITELTSDVTAGPGSGSQVSTVVSVGGSSASNIHNAELAANAATDSNTASTIVKRDGSGDFSSGTITASLTGHASADLPLTGGDLSGDVTVAASKKIGLDGPSGHIFLTRDPSVGDAIVGSSGTDGSLLITTSPSDTSVVQLTKTNAASGGAQIELDPGDFFLQLGALGGLEGSAKFFFKDNSFATLASLDSTGNLTNKGTIFTPVVKPNTAISNDLNIDVTGSGGNINLGFDGDADAVARFNLSAGNVFIQFGQGSIFANLQLQNGQYSIVDSSTGRTFSIGLAGPLASGYSISFPAQAGAANSVIQFNDAFGTIGFSSDLSLTSVTVSSFLNLPALTTPPGSPVAGQVYFDTTISSGTATGSIQVYDGTSWHTVTTI